MPRQLKSGSGWRLGWDDEAIAFQGLIGGDGWAIELTAAELEDFCKLLTQLAETLRQVSQDLMREERISCEVESELIWLEAEGYPQDYDLRLIVLTGRRGEGFWNASAVSELLQATQVLKVF
ncbi:MAG: DUF1818 family protein [Timaviella obliquedivisa GSE-PSE-MK23-08B]|jgi:hypothetical protein|nr:DUF1818 family protein [Timaviella obliquedivisa GSE-PSE-MK23-08B]